MDQVEAPGLISIARRQCGPWTWEAEVCFLYKNAEIKLKSKGTVTPGGPFCGADDDDSEVPEDETEAPTSDPAVAQAQAARKAASKAVKKAADFARAHPELLIPGAGPAIFAAKALARTIAKTRRERASGVDDGPSAKMLAQLRYDPAFQKALKAARFFL